VLDQVHYHETEREIRFSYAELLAARGAFEQAIPHYRAAMAGAPQRGRG
jgi:Flp pilus assembly protein TadD